MAVKLKNIIDEIERLAPPSLAVSRDNCGLIIGRENSEIKRVLLSLDATMDAIDECIEKNCDCIITHHPFMFETKKINDKTALGRRILKAVENKIVIYSAHTNLDMCDGGINDRLCEILGIIVDEKLYEDGSPVGRAGHFERELSLEEAVSLAKEKLGLTSVKYCGDNSHMVKKAGVISGSGMTYLSCVAESGCDVFFTGDLRMGNSMQAADLGVSVVDLTHYGSEVIILPYLKELLDRKFDLEIMLSEKNKEIFHYMK